MKLVGHVADAGGDVMCSRETYRELTFWYEYALMLGWCCKMCL
jgi:hypothetical protein